ncbi:MAG TPA: insulinase family protein [Candidatus Marinimicrobia bacterium]|nr:insulinase family protein [Candidatus Neomarinimicrobiota bacterium]
MIQRFNKSTLNSGVRILTETVDSVGTCAVGVFVFTGTKDETLAINGIAHFIEHLNFKGTDTRSAAEIADAIESRGGQLDAYTSKEITAYYAHILPRDIPVTVAVLADILQNSLYLEEDIALERSVIHEEIDENLDTPQEYAFDTFTRYCFPRHALGYPILGNHRSLNKIQRDDLQDFIRKNYTAGRIVVAAVGAVEHSVFAEWVRRAFEAYPYEAGKRKVRKLHQPEPFSERKAIAGNQAHVLLGRQSYSYHFPRRYSYQMIHALLSAGMSSRLFQNIREKTGAVYSIFSFLDMFTEGGLFGVYFATDRERVKESISRVFDEFEILRREKVSKKELEKVKMQYEGSLILNSESMVHRLERMCRYEFQFERFISISEIIAATRKIESEEIIALASELLDPDTYNSILFLPESEV